MTNPTGTIFNIQRFSTEDGPGIRTTVFVKGCPLKCLWCANPESQAHELQTAHRQSKCRGCGVCVSTCSEKAIRLHIADGQPQIQIDRTLCRVCGACVKSCSAGSLRIFGEEKTADEVFETVERDIGYYDKSDGGMTVSGGEPMMQVEFITALYQRCRRVGIHTALDTCGYFPTERVKQMEGLLDLVLFDLKLMDSALHKKYTGVPNELILENLRAFNDMGVRIFIRIPLIPDINDTEENLQATAEFVRALNPALHVDLLPYHNFGENKYKMLDMDYALPGAKRQSQEKLEACRDIFTGLGLDCTLH